MLSVTASLKLCHWLIPCYAVCVQYRRSCKRDWDGRGGPEGRALCVSQAIEEANYLLHCIARAAVAAAEREREHGW